MSHSDCGALACSESAGKLRFITRLQYLITQRVLALNDFQLIVSGVNGSIGDLVQASRNALHQIEMQYQLGNSVAVQLTLN